MTGPAPRDPGAEARGQRSQTLRRVVWTTMATATTSRKLDVVTAKLALLQLIAPLAPTAGVVHVQPAGAMSETNVVPEGSVSLQLALVALSGPLFVTSME